MQLLRQKKKINEGNGRCSLSLHSSHREGDAAAIELFHIGGWQNQKTILKYFKPLTAYHLNAVPWDSWFLGALTDLLTKWLFTFKSLDPYKVWDISRNKVGITGEAGWGVELCAVGDRNYAEASSGKTEVVILALLINSPWY